MRIDRRKAMTSAVAGGLLFAGFLWSCDDHELAQGQGYLPDGAIPLGTPSLRTDLDGGTCDGDSACDASPPPVDIVPDGGALPINTCQSARSLGTMSGDKGPSFVSGMGTCSEWFSVRVTENDSSALGVGMKVLITMMPTGADYELYAYLDKDRDVLSCGAPIASSFNRGTETEKIELSWGEGTVANGADDSRTLTIAVIRAAGPCTTGSYSLRVEH